VSATATVRVRFHELDPNGHVNHGVYANWFETARIEALEDRGVGHRTLAAQGVHLVVVELRIRFRRPALGGQTLTIESTIGELRRASCWWHQRLLDEDGQVLAEAEVRSSATDAAGRPVPPPPDLAAALAGLRGRTQTSER
jgi:acyl-CoA thioester hydrolase